MMIKRLVPFLGILLLIVLLAVISKSINQGAKSDADERAEQAAAEEKAEAPAAPKNTSKMTAADPISSEIAVGNMVSAPIKIAVGWNYDDANQHAPEKLLAVVALIQKKVAASGGRAAVEIVNLDVPAEDLGSAASLVTGQGIAVNGQSTVSLGGKEISLAGNPGEGELVPDMIGRVLDAQLASGRANP